VKLRRILRHLTPAAWSLRRSFPPTLLKEIEEAVATSEKKHGGEIRFAIEASLPLGKLSLTARQRALEVFSTLRVWDTENNNGVLIYILLADREVELLADRGLNGKAAPRDWEKICRVMEENFRRGCFAEGARRGIHAAADILARHFPPGPRNVNELPDGPEIL
jgi:uncharacterized membrane protein